jgi:hypothetical protein
VSRHSPAFTYDPNQSRVGLFGGKVTTAVLDDLQFANGATTTRVYPVGPAPSPRAGAAMVYDEARKRIVLIGGADNSGAAFADATWEQFMTGQDCTLNDQCATNVCATTVCCLTKCDPPCRDCDRVNVMLDPPAIDGECRLVTGMDPRFCVFDQGCRGTCSEIATCVYPDRTKACGLCLACNQMNGKCDQLPMSEDDPNCKPPSGMVMPTCAGANVKCRTYGTPSVLHRCIARGKCGWRWSDCTNLLTDSFPCK